MRRKGLKGIALFIMILLLALTQMPAKMARADELVITGSLAIKVNTFGPNIQVPDTAEFEITGPDPILTQPKIVTYAQLKDGNFKLENLLLGTYTVKLKEETAQWPGHNLIVDNNKTATLTDSSPNQIVTITNTYYDKGDGFLTIQKSTQGGETPQDAKFVIKGSNPNYPLITVSYSEFVNGEYKLGNLVFGDYSVTEDESTAQRIGYDLTVAGNGASVEINPEQLEATLQLTNIYEKNSGDLKIRKELDGNAFNDKDTFRIRVTVYKAGSQTADSTVNGTGYCAKLNFLNGVAECEISNLETIIITGLPNHAGYMVEEIDDKGYTPEYKTIDYSAAKPVEIVGSHTGTIDMNKSADKAPVVVIKNTKNSFGGLRVEKKIDGNIAELTKPFHFTVTLKKADGTPVSGIYGTGDTAFVFDSSGIMEFDLKAGEYKEGIGIENGLSYTVREEDYSAEGYSTTPARELSGTIIGTQSSASQASVHNNNKIIITNTKKGKYVNIKYQYKDGTEAAKPFTKILEYGKKYSVDSPAIEGYTPDKASIAGQMGDKDVEETVTYMVNSHKLTIAYAFGDGSQAAPAHTEVFDYGTQYSVSSPIITGYTADKKSVTGKMPDQDVKAEVVYNADKHTITYDTDGGSKIDPLTLVYGTEIKAPADPKKDGFIFSGWDPEIPETMPAKDLTVKAKWEKIPEPETKEPETETKEPETETKAPEVPDIEEPETEAPLSEEPSDPEKEEVPIRGKLLVKMTAKGKRSLKLTWKKVKGAQGYDIFFSRCSHGSRRRVCKKVKTIKGNKTFKWVKKGLKKNTSYKAYVRAWVKEDGKKTYISTSPLVHAYTSGGSGEYTAPRSVSVKKKKVTLTAGQTYKIRAKVRKLKKGRKLMPSSHAAKLRYMSSNKKVAIVSRSGRIKAKAKGNCKVYVYAANGVSKTIRITVR